MPARPTGMTRAQLQERARRRALAEAKREAARQAWREGRRARLERLPHGAIWHVVQVARAKESAAERALIEAGWHAYCPMERVTIGTGARRCDVERALFPGYLFVARNRCEASLRACRDVIAVLGDGRDGYAMVRGESLQPLIDSEMLGLFDATDAIKRAKARARRAKISTGQRVTIGEGPFAGIVGKIKAMQPNERVLVLIALAGGGQVPVVVGIDKLCEAA